MGIIKRQGIKTTLVNLLGSAIGAFSVLFIYPLADDIYGYAQWLYNTAYLLVPFATLGILSLIVKFFPNFNNEKAKAFNGFLSLILILLSLTFLLFLGLWQFLNPQAVRLLNFLGMEGDLLQDNSRYILGLLGALILMQFFINQSMNRLRIVIPNLISQLGYKIFLPILVLVYVYYGIDQSDFALAIILFFVLVNVCLCMYLITIKGLKLGKIQKPSNGFSYKEMTKYSLFGSLNQLSQGLAFRVDSVMIPLFLDMLKNGVYNKVLFIGNVIEMPMRAINQISAPIISKAWKDNDLLEIKKVYQKATNNLFLIGAFIFLIIWYVLDDLIQLSSNPDSFPNARNIFLLIALGKLVDMLTSINGQIIIYSKKYKYNLIFLIFLAVSNVSLNFILIPKYGILGAAMATAISLTAYNVIKLVFIYFSYGLLPFQKSNIKTFLVLIMLAGLFYLIVLPFGPIVNIIIKLAFLSLVFTSIAYFWKISEDMNGLAREALGYFKR